MKFNKTKIENCFRVELNKIQDQRGFFSRMYCLKENKNNKIMINNFVQSNNSYNLKKGTFRGLHFQKKPYEEDKLIRCINGEVFFVILDLRKRSKTYLKTISMRINSKNRSMILIPKGCANGYLTLKNNTELLYFCSNYYAPKFADGLRYNDKLIKIKFPIKIKHINKKDLEWKDFKISK